MALGLFGCGSGLSDTTKRLTPQQSEDSEQNANHTGNEDQQAEADTTEKKAEDGSAETSFGYRYRQFALNLLQQTYEDGKNEMISPLSVLAALTMTEMVQKQYAVTDGAGSVGWNTGRAAGQRTFFVYEKTGRYREYASKHCKFNLAERCRHLTCGGRFPVRKQ